MFGQMEGKSWPYANNAVSSSQSEPSITPVGHWRFDEGSGTSTKDASGTGNNGILMNGATWRTGKSGSAIFLDGVDDFVKVSSTNFSPSQGTLTLWVNPISQTAKPRYIFGHTSIPAYSNRIQLYTDDTQGHLDAGLGSNHANGLNIQQLQLNSWHHVALTWSSGTYAVYVNGSQRTTGTYSGLTSLGTYAHIGGSGLDSKPEAWSGLIDDVKIWNRALDSTEIMMDYNPTGTSPLAPQALVVELAK
jgi:hypothetical protein